VAIANLKALRDEGVVTQVKTDTGPYLQNCLREVFGNHPLLGEIQGVGLVAPSLIATRAELDELVDKTRIAVDRTAQEYGVL
jgi:putrescine---pyruvate transaminase